MKTLDFAKKYIRFNKTSPVTGDFRIEMYPFLAAPFNASDDIRVKRLVVYKASSCLGSVFGQIVNAKRIACDVGDQIMVCQTDDDAEKFTKTRGREWLESIPDVMRLLLEGKNSQTNALWLFRHKFLIITGPGITSAQSDQVRYVQTDESHLSTYPPGRLVEFEKRMGARWDRQGTHITTAADEGKEIDQFFYQADQNEWHWRCAKCNELVWPLWEEDAQAQYNGERVFQWTEQQSETATLESIVAVCPHCQNVKRDTSRDRYSLQYGADYVAKNPEAPVEFASFRWSALAAAHWMPWRDLLAEYKASMHAWTIGDLKPYEDWNKKRLCKTWIARAPALLASSGSDYSLGTQWETQQEKLRVCSFDIQEENGFHLWGQVDEFERDGSSRRIDYQKLMTWNQAREFQHHHQVVSHDTYSDAGRRTREVFGRCEEWGWYALFSDDAMEFDHALSNPKGKHLPKIHIARPYSQSQPEDAMIGKSGERIQRYRQIPAGHCLSRRWSKFVIGGYLMALKKGESKYYGIAKDMPPVYTDQLNSYAYVRQQNKKDGTWEIILKQIRKDDHSFSTSSMALLGAIIRGFFPLAETAQTQEA